MAKSITGTPWYPLLPNVVLRIQSSCVRSGVNMASQHQKKIPRPTAAPAVLHKNKPNIPLTPAVTQASASSAKVIRGPAQRLVSRGSTAPEVQADAKESPDKSDSEGLVKTVRDE